MTLEQILKFGINDALTKCSSESSVLWELYRCLERENYREYLIVTVRERIEAEVIESSNSAQVSACVIAQMWFNYLEYYNRISEKPNDSEWDILREHIAQNVDKYYKD